MMGQKFPTFQSCEVLAEIEIFGYDEKQGIGRKNFIKSNYRPNHWFGNYQKIDGSLSKMFLMGNIELLEQETLEPNEIGLAQVAFLGIAENIDKIEVGFEWQIFEAPRLIGKGKVLEILPNVETQWI